MTLCSCTRTLDQSISGDGGSTTCPSGYTKGTANGLAVCRAPSGVPLFSHVLVIVMENTSLSTLTSSTNTPFLHGLSTMYASASDYHGVAHPSLPNYIALTSGDTQSIGCDCDPTGSACTQLDCNALIHNCGCGQTVAHLGAQLDAAGKRWRAYAEDLMTPCNLTSSGNYAVRHVPFLYYSDVAGDATKCNDRVVDFAMQFNADLTSNSMFPQFAFIAPNLIHDMHDPFPATSTNLANGDQWLMQIVPQILASTAFQENGALFIVWDEDDLSGVLAKDDPIPLYVISPLAKKNYSGGMHADHYSLLATIEDGLNVPRLGNAQMATPLGDYFPSE
jgi:hypothetical protein